MASVPSNKRTASTPTVDAPVRRGAAGSRAAGDAAGTATVAGGGCGATVGGGGVGRGRVLVVAAIWSSAWGGTAAGRCGAAPAAGCRAVAGDACGAAARAGAAGALPGFGPAGADSTCGLGAPPSAGPPGRESIYSVPADSRTKTAASEAAATRVMPYQRRRRTTLGGSTSSRGPSAKSRGGSRSGNWRSSAETERNPSALLSQLPD